MNAISVSAHGRTSDEGDEFMRLKLSLIALFTAMAAGAAHGEGTSGKVPFKVEEGPLAGLSLDMGVGSATLKEGTAPTVEAFGLSGLMLDGYKTSLTVGADGAIGASTGRDGMSLNMKAGPSGQAVGIGYKAKFP